MISGANYVATRPLLNSFITAVCPEWKQKQILRSAQNDVVEGTVILNEVKDLL